MVWNYWQFVQNFATKEEPLTNLTNKGLPKNIKWTEKTETAYKTLKHDLSHSVMLKNPDFTQTFQLQRDALDIEVRPILTKEENKINILPIIAGSY